MAASGQYFQNEAHSLELNRRMSVLLDTHMQRKQEDNNNEGQQLKDATAEATQSNNDDRSHGDLEPQAQEAKDVCCSKHKCLK